MGRAGRGDAWSHPLPVSEGGDSQASLARLNQRLYSQQLNSVPQENRNAKNVCIVLEKKVSVEIIQISS